MFYFAHLHNWSWCHWSRAADRDLVRLLAFLVCLIYGHRAWQQQHYSSEAFVDIRPSQKGRSELLLPGEGTNPEIALSQS